MTGDLALLEMVRPLSPLPAPFSISHSSGIEVDRPLSAFAFTESQQNGIYTRVVPKGETADGLWQVDLDQSAQYEVQSGFSGGPVFDVSGTRLLLMFVAADKKGPKSGFAIPGEALLDYLDGLDGFSDLANDLRRIHALPDIHALPEHADPIAWPPTNPPAFLRRFGIGVLEQTAVPMNLIQAITRATPTAA